jgi:hypothetical protein
MSAMVNFEVPWINVLTKMDLVNPKSQEDGGPRNGPRLKRDVQRYLEPDPFLLESSKSSQSSNPKFHALNRGIVQLVRQPETALSTRVNCSQIEDHPLVAFIPLDLTSTDSLEYLLSSIDFSIQYGEDEEPKEVSSHPTRRRTISHLYLPSHRSWTRGISWRRWTSIYMCEFPEMFCTFTCTATIACIECRRSQSQRPKGRPTPPIARVARSHIACWGSKQSGSKYGSALRFSAAQDEDLLGTGLGRPLTRSITGS